VAIGWTGHPHGRAPQRERDERVQGFITENVALIKSLGDHAARGDRGAGHARVRGRRAARDDLASDIIARFGVAEDRAKLIARDQIGKLNGRISRRPSPENGPRRSSSWRDVGDSPRAPCAPST
jgi:hypothetical protein